MLFVVHHSSSIDRRAAAPRGHATPLFVRGPLRHSVRRRPAAPRPRLHAMLLLVRSRRRPSLRHSGRQRAAAPRLRLLATPLLVRGHRRPSCRHCMQLRAAAPRPRVHATLFLVRGRRRPSLLISVTLSLRFNYTIIRYPTRGCFFFGLGGARVATVNVSSGAREAAFQAGSRALRQPASSTRLVGFDSCTGSSSWAGAPTPCSI